MVPKHQLGKYLQASYQKRSQELPSWNMSGPRSCQRRKDWTLPITRTYRPEMIMLPIPVENNLSNRPSYWSQSFKQSCSSTPKKIIFRNSGYRTFSIPRSFQSCRRMKHEQRNLNPLRLPTIYNRHYTYWKADTHSYRNHWGGIEVDSPIGHKTYYSKSYRSCKPVTSNYLHKYLCWPQWLLSTMAGG